MAAPLYLERLACSLHTKLGSASKCFGIPIPQTFSIVGGERSKVNAKNGIRGASHFCSFQHKESNPEATATLLPNTMPMSKSFPFPALTLTMGFTMMQKESPLDLKRNSFSGAPWCLTQVRHYGRKVKPKPPKLTNFEYAGDLRTLPEIDKNVLLHPYIDLEGDMDETTRKLASFEFASVTQQNKHMRQLVENRILELFGPDSELEMEIATRTLQIRLMIPYCIRMRVDKVKKIWLLKTIFRRRRLLNQLRHLDYERFEWLLRELKIRYVVPQDREEFKGWKHNLREATKEETLMEQRKKLEEFREKMQAEKEEFYQHKAQILAQIEKDLESFGLAKDYLESVQVKERYRKKYHKILNWDERVKLGMTDKIKDYYG